MAQQSIHPETCMGPVRLKVADLERSLSFYQDVLGLRPHSTNDGVVSLGAGSRPLVELAAQPGARPAGRSTGLFHLALLLPSQEDLARWLAHLQETGWPLQGASDHGVSEAIYLADAEGNGIEVYRDRERGRWPFVQGRLRMATEPLDLQGLLQKAEGRAWEGMPAQARIGHVHLKASQIAPCERFYCHVLGFELMQRYGSEASFTSAGGYHHHIAFNVWNSRGAPPAPQDATGLAHFTVLVPDSQELDRVHSRLKAAGHEVDEREESLWMRDPSGNALRLSAA